MPDGPESTGLTEEEAARRLRAEGPNELPSRERRTLSHELLDVVREPMTALLLACGGIYVVLGDAHEAAMLLGSSCSSSSSRCTRSARPSARSRPCASSRARAHS